MPIATGNYIVKAQVPSIKTEVQTSLSVIAYKERYAFSVISNSSVSNLSFNATSRHLSFIVSGPANTSGYANVTIAKDLIEDIQDLKVYIDGQESDCSILSSDDSCIIQFTYIHTTHNVIVSLASSLPNPFFQTSIGIAIIGIIIFFITGFIIYMKLVKSTKK
jgi:hypothetical protein